MANVHLVSITPGADRLIYLAGRRCYSDMEYAELDFEAHHAKQDKVDRFLTRLMASGHLSPFEMAHAVFCVDRVSRAETHQQVRHRHMSYAQQSARYTKVDSSDLVIPPSVANNPKALHIAIGVAEQATQAYEQLLALDIPREDARMFTFVSTPSSIVIGGNFRAWMEYFPKRLCKRAQWEIRDVSYQILSYFKQAYPMMFSHIGPACKTGGCHESVPCSSA